MADEAEGSGEGSGAARGSWDDDDDNADYSSGDGSGENPITTQLPNADDSQCKYCFLHNIKRMNINMFITVVIVEKQITKSIVDILK